MENAVLTIGGLLKSFNWSDAILLLIGLAIVLLIVYTVYILGTKEKTLPKPIEGKKESSDIQNIIENLEANYEVRPIDLSEYEQELEDTAIISYEELLEKTKTNISYDDISKLEYGDIAVKKINPTDMSSTKESANIPKKVNNDYEREEAFLATLKKIQKNLVR